MFRLLLVVLFILSSQASWARQSCDWPFRTTVTVNQTNFDGLSDYPVDLVLTASNLHPDYQWTNNGADLRIYSDDDSTPLPFKINNWSATNKSAEVRVSFPTLNMGTRNIFIYYGNETVSSLSTTVSGLPFVPGKIKFHTRAINGQDPDSQAQAKLIFNQGNDIDQNTSLNPYGCSHPENFTGVTNSNQGPTNSTRSNSGFIAYSKTLFTVAPGQAGNWGIRYGADFGYGGGLYVDKVNILDENWDPLSDFWWGGNWNSAYVLKGSVYLTEGEHEMEIIGGENCCDGGVTVEFSRNYSGPTEYSTATWLPFTSNNISIRSEACPISTLTVSYGSHDACYKNLSLTSPQNSNQSWIAGSNHTLNFTINNLEISENLNPKTVVSFTLPPDISLNSATGSNWLCTGSSTIQCIYNQTVLASASSTPLTLDLALSSSATAGNTVNITATISGNAPDNITSDNSINFSVFVLSSSGVPAGCSNPQPGLLAKFFDITGYSPNNISNAIEFQNLVNARAIMQNLQGQTIAGNINGSGNPLSTSDDYYLAIFEGYYYSSTSTRMRFGVDGDDAIEAWINGSIVSTFYGQHPAAGSAQDINRIDIFQGFNPIEFRMQEATGQDQYNFYSGTRINNQTIIPANSFFHCAGDPNIQLSTSIEVTSDPINASNFKAIPGAEITYTVNVENLGQISTDLNSTELVQALAPNTQLFVGDFNPSGGPIIFTDGTGDTASGVSYVYTSLNNNTDSISFSTDGINFNHPVTNTNGYDTAITHFKLTLPGTMKPTFSGITPTFSFQYRVQVK